MDAVEIVSNIAALSRQSRQAYRFRFLDQGTDLLGHPCPGDECEGIDQSFPWPEAMEKFTEWEAASMYAVHSKLLTGKEDVNRIWPEWTSVLIPEDFELA